MCHTLLNVLQITDMAVVQNSRLHLMTFKYGKCILLESVQKLCTMSIFKFVLASAAASI